MLEPGSGSGELARGCRRAWVALASNLPLLGLCLCVELAPAPSASPPPSSSEWTAVLTPGLSLSRPSGRTGTAVVCPRLWPHGLPLEVGSVTWTRVPPGLLPPPGAQSSSEPAGRWLGPGSLCRAPGLGPSRELLQVPLSALPAAPPFSAGRVHCLPGALLSSLVTAPGLLTPPSPPALSTQKAAFPCHAYTSGRLGRPAAFCPAHPLRGASVSRRFLRCLPGSGGAVAGSCPVLLAGVPRWVSPVARPGRLLTGWFWGSPLGL